ncbi:hypothetical protein C3B44_10935 [Corynebacterium yudongzhengii]|uniref:Trehalose O-mycolyltransferase n=1 Tax=Corynebacterium yudongzhengii TaxID=2080740 RepID=A0A2U1T8E2_9CORY|nr:alpha/beta hydrolase-fold protein [Corynebacterium yudongzhengii]AWB82782.1 hypothetical protein C3B44_10935 [Corynebacterium yudongzhengii]PWC02158.1 hypothetical protein DF222_03460 [Corynebacterium yudongzhengii]
MRDTANRSPRRNRRLRHPALLAIPTAAAVGLAVIPAVNAQNSSDLSSSLSSQFGGGPGSGFSDTARPEGNPARTPRETTYPVVENLPAGVEVNRVEWLSNRHIAIFMSSAAMPDEEIQVQMLLARDWHANPEKTFPEVWALDGLRARDDENGWTLETNIIEQYADRNVNVVLPVGGESSFYADWLEPDPNNGVHYMWETFLTQELIPVLDNAFRSNQKRAIVGLSMGGTAAVNLAERNPHLFDFVGSFSGYLDTTSSGMPEAITAAMLDAGGYSSTAMWGPLYSQGWIDHDPKLGIEALEDMTVYVSSGSGADDYGQENSVANGPANPAGVGLEILSRLTTQTFVDRAANTNTDVITRFRPSGVHSWEYWQFEMQEAWPIIAEALDIPEEDRGADCQPVGAIASVTADGQIGSCVNNEYPVGENGEGRAQDFRSGTAYWSPQTDVHALFGAINARYAEFGGPNGWLGFPKTGERSTPDGRGRYVHFENGSIYWTPQTGAYAIQKDMFDYWGSQGWENSHIKYPVAEAKAINGGWVQEFENGWLTESPDGTQRFIVHGAIADKYGEIDTANSELGFPTSNERSIRGGAFQEFENGNIYWSPATGAHAILYGDIFDAWGQEGWEQGRYGFPTADTETIPAGGLRQEFQNGTLEQINGLVREAN